MSDFTLCNLNYTENLLAHYQKLANLPGFVLLHSSDQERGRYDIVTAYPYQEMKLDAHSSSLNTAFEQLQDALPSIHSSYDLPFQGGAIGYFSYDLGARLFNIYSKPQKTLEGLPLMHMGFYDWAIISDHHLKKVTLFAANVHSKTQLIVKEILALWFQPCIAAKTFALKDRIKPLISKPLYQKSFSSIYRYLTEGRCYQVNYTQPFTAPFEGETWSLYQQIQKQNPVPFSAFLHYADADILSFSPERFLQHQEGLLLTSPIKGSAKRNSNRQKDELLKHNLLKSAKNKAENVMIVDLLRNDLGKIARPGSVVVKALCEIQSFAAVHHLVSHIEALCREEISPLQAFKACFPGGSITGAPKLEAMRVIAEEEPYGRSIYCGSIAYFSHHGRFDSSIAIRTVIAREGILHLAAGGGVVIDSLWEEEYEECFTKLAGISNALV